MRLLISVVLFISILFSSLLVLANDCPKATPIFQGDTATCDGVILSEVKVKEYLNLKMEGKTIQEKLDLEKLIREREMKVCKTKLRAAESRISHKENPPWWQTAKFSRWLGFVGGVVVSAVAVLTFQ